MIMNFEKIINMPPDELLAWLESEFLEELPAEILTVQDMEEAARLLLKLSSSYSYLCSLLSHSKIASRRLKRSGDKKAYEDMVDRKEAVSNILDAVKQQYNAVSRSVTIKIENNRELGMNTNGFIPSR